MGVQGTAIRKATKDSVELGRRQAVQRVFNKAREKLDQGGPDEAASFVGGATARDPNLRLEPEIAVLSRQLHREQVTEALRRVGRSVYGPDFNIVEEYAHGKGMIFDIALWRTDNPARVVCVDLITTSERVPRYRIEGLIAKLDVAGTPGIIVMTQPLSEETIGEASCKPEKAPGHPVHDLARP